MSRARAVVVLQPRMLFTCDSASSCAAGVGAQVGAAVSRAVHCRPPCACLANPAQPCSAWQLVARHASCSYNAAAPAPARGAGSAYPGWCTAAACDRIAPQTRPGRQTRRHRRRCWRGWEVVGSALEPYGCRCKPGMARQFRVCEQWDRRRTLRPSDPGIACSTAAQPKHPPSRQPAPTCCRQRRARHRRCRWRRGCPRAGWAASHRSYRCHNPAGMEGKGRWCRKE